MIRTNDRVHHTKICPRWKSNSQPLGLAARITNLSNLLSRNKQTVCSQSNYRSYLTGIKY